MPNWCENCLEVIGDENEIKRFCETGLTTVANKDGEIEQEWSLLPYYPYPDGKWDYDWCVDNWGTKWDVDEPIHECNGDSRSFKYFAKIEMPALRALFIGICE